jgi:Ca-activated chloride channel family protein
LDNGVRQRLELVARHEASPVHAILVLDTSSSVAGRKLERLKRAAGAFLGGLGQGDRATLLTFSHELRLVSALGAEPTAARRALRGAEAAGGTALHDAIFAALHLGDPQLGRPMLLVFSDGEDGLSWLSPEKVMAAARYLDAVVFTVHARARPAHLDETPVELARRGVKPGKLLKELARITGGQAWDVEAGDLEAAFHAVLAQIKSRYLLRYEPRGVNCDGWHDLELRLEGLKGRVRARSGYLAACDAF